MIGQSELFFNLQFVFASFYAQSMDDRYVDKVTIVPPISKARFVSDLPIHYAGPVRRFGNI